MPGNHHFTTSRHLGSTPFLQVPMLVKDMLSCWPTIVLPLSSSSCSDSPVVSRRTSLQMCRGMPEWVAEVPRDPPLEHLRSAVAVPLARLKHQRLRTTFPLPRNVLLRPCLRCTSTSAHTPFVHLVDNLVRQPPQLILDKGAFGVGVVPNH